MRPLWMLELDLEHEDCHRQRRDWIPDAIAVAVGAAFVLGALLAGLLLWD